MTHSKITDRITQLNQEYDALDHEITELRVRMNEVARERAALHRQLQEEEQLKRGL